MNVEQTALADVLILTPRRFEDPRGWFSEVWNQETLRGLGVDIGFVQDNHSYSAPAGTVRGLHYQAPPHAQDKLVRVGRGAVFDVAVDVRNGSPNYGKWVGVELSAQNGKQLWVPKGFLHGFVTLEPETEVLYKCSDYYAADCDGAVRFDDPDIGVNWAKYLQEFTVSDKDANAPAFRDFKSPFEFCGCSAQSKS